jgi:hypothetical protein
VFSDPGSQGKACPGAGEQRKHPLGVAHYRSMKPPYLLANASAHTTTTSTTTTWSLSPSPLSPSLSPSHGSVHVLKKACVCLKGGSVCCYYVCATS